MDASSASVLAAAIAALVAAGTFAAAEIIKTVRSVMDRRAEAVSRLLDAVERIAVIESRPLIVRMYARPDIRVVHASTRLLDVLPKRDLPVAYWVSLRLADLGTANRVERVAIAAEVNARVMLWRRDPRPLRTWFRDQLVETPDGLLRLRLESPERGSDRERRTH